MFFLFFQFILANDILFNTKVHLYFINSSPNTFNIPKKFLKLPKSTFKIKKIGFNEWKFLNESYNNKKTYVSLVRGSFILFFDQFLEENTDQYIKSAVISRFSSVKTEYDCNDNNNHFILKGNHIPIEYEDLAFRGLETNTSFYFIKNDDIFELSMASPRYNYSCKMLSNETMTAFVQRAKNIANLGNEYTFVVVTDFFNDVINKYIADIKNNYRGAIEIKIMTHKMFEPIRVLSNTSVSDTSYFLIKKTESEHNVWIYPNEDVASSNSLIFFIENILSKRYLLGKSVSLNNSKGQFITNIMDIQEKFPSDKYSVVMFQNTKSISNFDVLVLFHMFARLRQKNDINYFTVDLEKTHLPTYVPNFDGFPSICLWKPNDYHPYVFNNEMNRENIIEWFDSLYN